MNPITKTLSIVLGSILSIFLVPAILIIFHEYIYAFLAITLALACFMLFGYISYIELLPVLQREQLEEDEIMARFDGDPEKIRFYKGFKKYFDGDVSSEGLKQWFIHHPRKY